MDFDMGKYVGYVWGAYGISFVALIALVGVSFKAHRDAAAKLKSLQVAERKDVGQP